LIQQLVWPTGAARKKKEVGAAVEALEEEPSTSGRPELEAPVAPAEDVQDVTEIVQTATAAETVPARQQDSVRLRCCIFCAVSL